MLKSILDANVCVSCACFRTPPVVKFSYPKEVDFGAHVCDGRVLTRSLKLTNDGALAGHFSLACKGNFPLVFKPEFGVVPPHGSQEIKVRS